MSAASALQKAIYERLGGDPALTALVGPEGVTDRLADKPHLPLVVIRTIESTDRSTSTEDGEEHLVTLEVWSEGAGNREAQVIAGRLRALLHDAQVTLEGHHLVSLFHRRTVTGREGKSRYHRAEMRFRAMTEAAG
ncbi:MAG: DUF3168 domain-containing protein [Shinella sp.]|nr:DUF3168 domain-containing protein [Shinella sp.]